MKNLSKYPDKHPFENAPAEILDERIEINTKYDYAEHQIFSYRLIKIKKEFVMEALKYAGPEYDQIGLI